MQYSFITSEQIDIITNNVLLESEINMKWNGNISKVDVDYIIEFIYELEIEWKNIDHFSNDGIVLAAIKPIDKIIYMNETKKELFAKNMGTMNFTKAHELGHWILHVTEQKKYEQLFLPDNELFFCRSSTKIPQEIQADMFAASLLMPKDIIIGAINELKQKNEVNFSDLYILKDKFEASISSLVRRIKELNLLFFDGKKIYLNEADLMGQISLF